MACGSCGSRRQGVEYVITYRHDGSKETVSSLAEARLKLAQSPQGGSHKAVPKAK